MCTKIAYCIPSLCTSAGMERVLTVKANYLANYGYEIHIILTDGVDKEPAFPLEASIQIHQLNINFGEAYDYTSIRKAWIYWKKMREFRKKLNVCLNQIKPDITVSMLERDIDIIHQMTDGSMKIGEFHFNRLHFHHFQLPIYSYHFILRYWLKQLVFKLGKLSKFVVLTYEDAANWEELDNVTVIPNPTSFFPDELSDCKSKQVIAMGRYVPQKGFDRLIQAWRLVVDKFPDWQLKIYGDGRERSLLEQQVRELNLQDSCFLEHSTPDVASKMKESSIFVLSSRFEGFGLVLLEAMSCGLPVVSFACPCGPSEIISDEMDGFLVQEGDVGGLAAKIETLISDRELRKRMGQKARQKAENYRIERIGQYWIDLFEQLISNR